MQFNIKYAFFPLFYIGSLVTINLILLSLPGPKTTIAPFPLKTCSMEGICSTSTRAIFGSIGLFLGGFMLFLRSMQKLTVTSNFLIVVNTIIYTTLTIVTAALAYFIVLVAVGSNR